MCLTTAALAAFLTLLGPDMISAEPGRYVVHAEAGDAHWVRHPESGDRWCTMAPQLERMGRMAPAQGA